MSAALDLATASRDDLLALIATLQESVRTLEQRVHTLEAKLQSGVGKGVPGTKAARERWC